MRLWSSEILEIELAREQLSEREKAKYLLLPLLFAGFIGGPLALLAPRYGVRPPRFDSLVALANGILMVWATFYGFRKIYRANQQIDGRNFIERYTVLVLPVNVRFLVAMIPLLVVLSVALRVLGRGFTDSSDSLQPFYRLIFPLATLVFYHLLARSFIRFGRHLRRAAAPVP